MPLQSQVAAARGQAGASDATAAQLALEVKRLQVQGWGAQIVTEQGWGWQQQQGVTGPQGDVAHVIQGRSGASSCTSRQGRYCLQGVPKASTE